MDEALRSIPVEMVETPKEQEGLPVIEENRVETPNEEVPGDSQ
jgi:hypothetical protein